MRRENLKNGQFNQCHAELDSASLMRFRIKSGMTEVVGQAGRSMIEMLGVLAVVGLLSVMAFAAFRIALNKAKANTIVHDGRRMWVEALAWQNIKTPTDWIDSHYDSESGKKFSAMRDIKDNNYVKVEGVEAEVCERMLSMQQEGTLLFLTTEYEDFTTCEEGDHNTIVMAFDGLSGKPAECKDQKGCQDLHGLAFYCDGEGHCQECDETLSYVNTAGDGCECRSNARSCDGDGAHVWCCPNAQICGNKLNECVTCEDPLTMANEAGTACVCNPTIAVSCDDGQGNTWCCGGGLICDTTQPNGCKNGYGACNYTMIPQVQSVHANCQYTITRNANGGITVSPTPNVPQCSDDQYCYLYYTDENCEVPADGDGVGQMYGVCKPRTVVNNQCPVTIMGGGLRQDQGCPAAEYCYLKWADETCSAEADNDTTKLYGVCLSRNSTNAECPTN